MKTKSVVILIAGIFLFAACGNQASKQAIHAENAEEPEYKELKSVLPTENEKYDIENETTIL
jgi:uncharacterized lipoprotein YajG